MVTTEVDPKLSSVSSLPSPNTSPTTLPPSRLFSLTVKFLNLPGQPFSSWAPGAQADRTPVAEPQLLPDVPLPGCSLCSFLCLSRSRPTLDTHSKTMKPFAVPKVAFSSLLNFRFFHLYHSDFPPPIPPCIMTIYLSQWLSRVAADPRQWQHLASPTEAATLGMGSGHLF